MRSLEAGGGSSRWSEPPGSLCALLGILFLLSFSPSGYRLATAARGVTPAQGTVLSRKGTGIRGFSPGVSSLPPS